MCGGQRRTLFNRFCLSAFKDFENANQGVGLVQRGSLLSHFTTPMLSFCQCVFLPLCKNSGSRAMWILFWVFYSVLLTPCLFCARTMLFWLPWPYGVTCNQGLGNNIVSSSQVALATQGTLFIYINFIIFPCFIKNVVFWWGLNHVCGFIIQMFLNVICKALILFT